MPDLIQDWKIRKSTAKKQQDVFLKKIRKKRGKKLDELAEDLHDEVFSEIDCLDCANCCSSIPPMLNRTDINRLAKHLSMKPAAFQEQYIITDEDGDTVMNTTPCPFLLPDHKCMVYAYRPKACREYPHTNQLEFSKHFKLHRLNAQHCPAVFHILEKMMAHFP